LSNIEAQEGTMGAKELAVHTVKMAKEITHNDLSKWVSTTYLFNNASLSG
jgi:hypothetical protein